MITVGHYQMILSKISLRLTIAEKTTDEKEKKHQIKLIHKLIKEEMELNPFRLEHNK